MIEAIELIFNKKIEAGINSHLDNLSIEAFLGGKDSSGNSNWGHNYNKNVIYDQKAAVAALDVFKNVYKKNIEDEISKKTKNNKIYTEIESKITSIIASLEVPHLFKFDNELSLSSKTPEAKYYFQKYGGEHGTFSISQKGDLTINLSMRNAELNFGSKTSNHVGEIFNNAKIQTIQEVFASIKKPSFLKESQKLLPTARKINVEMEKFTKENMKKDRLFIYNLTKDFSINLRSDDPFSDFEIIKVMSDAPIIYVFLKHIEKIKEKIQAERKLNNINVENKI